MKLLAVCKCRRPLVYSYIGSQRGSCIYLSHFSQQPKATHKREVADDFNIVPPVCLPVWTGTRFYATTITLSTKMISRWDCL